MDFSRDDQDRLIQIVRRAARDQILPRFRNLALGQIQQKSSPADLVTEADIAAEDQMTREILQQFPGALVVGEEAEASDPDALAGLADADLAVIIDPIDGTWNYAKGLAVFGVIIAVTYRGRCVFGALYDPMADDWIMASEGDPAVHVPMAGDTARVKVAAERPKEQLSGHVPLFMLPAEKQVETLECCRGFGRVQSLGCSCHEYRLIATGRTDFCLSAPYHNPWDHAAGALVCREAGGYAAMLDGRDYDATVRDGYLLTANSRSTWEILRREFAYLLD